MSAKEMNRALSRIAKEIVEDRGLLQDYEGVRSRPFPIQNVAFYTVQSLYL
jgi:pyrimidine operon attenuation protein/uracil phosphoribosyltransferase